MGKATEVKEKTTRKVVQCSDAPCVASGMPDQNFSGPSAPEERRHADFIRKIPSPRLDLKKAIILYL